MAFTTERTVEPIAFICRSCGKTSKGSLAFTYHRETQRRGEYIWAEELEQTDGQARCEHCQQMVDVWTRSHRSEEWTKIEKKDNFK